MRYRLALYLSLTAVGLASFFGALFLPVSEVVKSLVALPFVGALFSALFQLLRDHSTFVKETMKQQREHAFLVAATSHMSAVVFDKHVEFSEAYVEKLLDVLGNLFAKGPTKEAMQYVRPLHEVRRKYRLWVSPSFAGALDDFESKLIRMGVSFGVWEARMHYEKGADKDLDRAYDLFREIMEVQQESKHDAEVEQKKLQGYTLVIKHLQGILGVEKLTHLRDTILDSAYAEGKKGHSEF